MGLFSLGLSARVVMRFGIRGRSSPGSGCMRCGLLWFARAPVDGMFALDVLPSMILLALGAGLAFNPLLLAAMGDVPPEQSGLASGLVNTTQMMGGAVGLAVLVSIAAARTADANDPADLTAGYHAAFLVGAAFAIVAPRAGGRAHAGEDARDGRRTGWKRRPSAHDGKPSASRGTSGMAEAVLLDSRRYPDPTRSRQTRPALFPALAPRTRGLVTRRAGSTA